MILKYIKQRLRVTVSRDENWVGINSRTYMIIRHFRVEHMHKKFEINQTKIKGGCQSGKKSGSPQFASKIQPKSLEAKQS